jgi:hypothetical protein
MAGGYRSKKGTKCIFLKNFLIMTGLSASLGIIIDLYNIFNVEKKISSGSFAN